MKLRIAWAAITLAVLLGGAVARLTWGSHSAHIIWMTGLVVMAIPVVFGTLRAAMQGRFATDVVATLSILGSIALDQPIAGLVIVLMQTGGEALEAYAEGKASAALRALEEAAPRTAHRVVGNRVEEITAAEVDVGDHLMIRPGDLIPSDGVVIEGESELDTSSLTGEPMPVSIEPGSHVLSGSLNGFRPFVIRATARAAESQYARVVELVRTAQASKAPIQRLADRYAVWFTPATLLICGIVFFVTHDWLRTLAVLVVATPCPLILAAPVAIIGGINRAARRRIIVRQGGALEQLARADIAVLDKTGTITMGCPRLSTVHVNEGFKHDDVLRLAAALEQGSSHLLGRVLVESAEEDGVAIPSSSGRVETPGQGVAGVVDGKNVRVGARSFVLPHCENGEAEAKRFEGEEQKLRAYLGVDGKLAAVFEYADEIRPELPDVLDTLRAYGCKRILLLSGDHTPIARAVAERAGITETYGDLMPGDKAKFVERLRSEGRGVMMVGDGVNDAPALSTANVGVALGTHGRGGGITTEAADVILLIDSLAGLSEAVEIGARTLRVAKQSIGVGLGLSGVAMIIAAFGGLAPAVGAAVQEVIDVAVILNALRSSREPMFGPGRIDTPLPVRCETGEPEDADATADRTASVSSSTPEQAA
jgi:heavy metal translocating P-type ATPase